MRTLSSALLAVCMLLALCMPGAAEMLDLSKLGEIEEAQMIEETAWTYPIPYELLKTSDYLVLVNRDNLLPEDYVPVDLVDDLTCRKVSYDKIQMRETAADALAVMFDAAKEDGITLYAHSGYRSYRTQKTMYYNRLQSNNGKDDGVVQYPGASEHQTGLTIDIINKSGIGKRFTNAFAETKEGKWVAEHCWDYGFIIRYQEEKREITQIAPESWHLRYVGVQVAQYMRDRNLCLEEFTEEWKEAVAEYEAAGK
ncbi:MAG: M15 family metallopeptidase [Clostridia bacterium]|nr:M15 family metallopeptidase [Clostridia bacterium]